MSNFLLRRVPVAVLLLALGASCGLGPNVYGRTARLGQRSGWNRPWRHRNIDQRGDAGLSRNHHQRVRRIQFLRCPAGDLYDSRELDRLQDQRAQGRPRRHAAVPHAGRHARSRAAAGNDHGHRRRPLIETSNASTGGTLDRQTLEALPAPGRNAFMIGVTVPTVTPTGDPQFNRQQDQTNASRISLGGGGVRANNYLLDGVPITELRGRAVLNPTIEALEEVKVQVHTYDAEMGRTGGGVFNVTAKSGTNEFHGSGFYQTRPVWGVNENFFVEKTGQVERRERSLRYLLPSLRRRLRRPDLEEPDVLLDRDRRLSVQHDAQRAAGVAEREAARRRFLDHDRRRRPGPHLQPVLPRRCRQRQVSGDRDRIARHRRRVHRRHHPADPPGSQCGRLRAARRVAHRDDCRRDRRQREQPAERQRHRSRSSTPRTCSRSRPNTSSPTPGR